MTTLRWSWSPTLVLGQSLRVAALGVGLGLDAALMANRAIAGLLFGVTPSDPFTFLAVGAMEALRYE